MQPAAPSQPFPACPCLSQGTQLGMGTAAMGDTGRPPPRAQPLLPGSQRGTGVQGTHTHCFWPGDRGAQPGWQSRGGGRRWQYHRGGHGEGLGGGTHSHGGKRHNSLHPPPSFRRRLGPNPALRPCHSTPISGCRRPQPSQRKHSGEEGGAMGRRGRIHRPRGRFRSWMEQTWGGGRLAPHFRPTGVGHRH